MINVLVVGMLHLALSLDNPVLNNAEESVIAYLQSRPF